MLHRLLGGVILFAIIIVGTAPVGGAPQQNDGVMQALLTEVRLLRLAIERQGVMAARGQLLMSRLGQCNQRVARIRSEGERVELALARQTQELGDTRIAIERDQQQLEAESDPEARVDRERGLRSLRQKLAQQTNAEADLQSRRTRLVQRADAEVAACETLESHAEQLLRELENQAK